MTLLQQLDQRLPKDLRQKLVAWWAARTDSERRTLTLGSLAAMAIVLVSTLMSVWSSHRLLENQLPALRSTAAQSQYWAERFVLQKPQKPESLSKALQQAQALFASEGFLTLDNPTTPSTENGAERYSMKIGGASLAHFLRWSEHLEQQLGLHIIDVNVRLQEDGNTYSGEMVVVR